MSTTALAIFLATIASAAARPQEAPGVTVDEVLQQALSNAGVEHPPFSGFEEGLSNFQGAEYGEGTEYGGQGSEFGGVFIPDAATNGVASQISPEQSHGAFEFFHPSPEMSPWFPTEETASLLPTLPAQGASFTSGVPPIDNNTPNVDTATLFPFGMGWATEAPNTNENGGSNPENLIGSLWNVLNNAQNGNATAGGAGSGSVQNGSAVGEGTGVVNIGFGGFGIGLGIGGAIKTPLGNLAFGQGSGVAVGR